MARKTTDPDKDSRVAEKEAYQQLGYFFEGGKTDVRLAG